jgi:predicted transposase YdaD
LSNKHDRFTIEQVGKEINKQGKPARLMAYLYAITSANQEATEEAIKMKSAFDQVMENTGLAARWEERGRSEGRAQEAFDIAQNMVNLGLPIETVISATRLDPEKVKVLYQH